MIPVNQTKFGAPFGNCLEACVASILEAPLAACMIFLQGIDLEKEFDIAKGEHWWMVFQRWLRDSRALQAIYLPLGELGGRQPKGYSIVSGKGPRGLNHSTVALDGVMIHDPHPSREGLLSVKDYIVFIHLVKKEKDGE